VSTLTRGDTTLATAQVAYDAGTLYARIHVVEDSPLKNGADSLGMIFKGGDAVGLDLGPAGARQAPVLGDVRLLAAVIDGAPRLVAMKPLTALEKHPDHYFTPAGGDRKFDFVGGVPGGRATLTPDADGKGYTALLAVPRSFLEVALRPGATLAAEIEVLLSGPGARGLQTVSRNYLFSPRRTETTMTDDLPTEAWIYPQYWGTAMVR
jgi:hypothetical protein